MRKQLKAALLLAAGLVLVVHAVAGAAAADGGFNVAFTVRPKIVLELDQVLAEFGDVFPGDNLRVQALTTRVWSNTLWDLSAYGPDEFTTGSGNPIPVERLRTKQYAQGPDGWKALTAGGTALITGGPRGGNKENSWDFNLFLDWEDGRLDVVYQAAITYTATNQ